VSTPLRRAIVSSAAITANVETLRRLAPAIDTMIVVKANGYGHGAVTVARAALAGGATLLGVADIAEALELRNAGIDAPLLAWLHAADEDFVDAIAANITLGVSTVSQLDRIAAAGGGTIHLKIDSGLGRNGVAGNDRDAFLDAAVAHHKSGSLTIDGIMSHVAGTSRASDLAQAEEFLRGIAELAERGIDPTHKHLAASAAAILHPSMRFTMVRFGIAAYGLHASDDVIDVPLTPAMRFEASVINVKRLREGDGVSYNHLWRASEPTTVALVSAGYADGVPRAATGHAEVAINGTRYPVVGRIAMDQIVVDVGDAPVREGDVAVLWGDSANGEPTANEWAKWAETIPYDIVTHVGARVAVRVEP
jgi:alanine racemase